MVAQLRALWVGSTPVGLWLTVMGARGHLAGRQGDEVPSLRVGERGAAAVMSCQHANLPEDLHWALVHLTARES